MPQEDPSGPGFPRGRRKEARHSESNPQADSDLGRGRRSAPIPDLILPRSEVPGLGGHWLSDRTVPFSPVVDVPAAGTDAGDRARVKGEDGDVLPLALAAPGPWRRPAPLPPDTRSLGCAPHSFKLPVAEPAARPPGPPPRPAPPHRAAAPNLGPQRPTAAGGAWRGRGRGVGMEGRVPRPWPAAHSRLGPLPLSRWPLAAWRGHLCRVGGRRAAVGWGFPGRGCQEVY